MTSHRQYDALNSDNTVISFCSDGTVAPEASGGAVLGTLPPTSGLLANHTTQWHHHNTTNNAGSSIVEWCSDTQQSLVDSVQNRTPHVDWNWPFPPWLLAPHDRTSTETLTVTSTHTEQKTLSPATFTASPSTSTTIPHSATITIIPPQPPNITEEPTTPSPPRKRTVTVATSVLLPDNEAAATVVLTTAGASGAVSSTLGSGGAGVVVTAGSSVRMMGCGLAEDDPRPASFEMPIQFAVGNGTMRYFAGAALAHALLQCCLLLLPVFTRRFTPRRSGRRPAQSKLLSGLSMLFCGAHAFFTPAILGACSTVLFNDDDGFSLAVAGGSALVIVVLHGVVAVAVHRGPQNGLVARRVAKSGNHTLKLEFDVLSSSSSTTTTSTSSSSDDECISDLVDRESTTTTTSSDSPRTTNSGSLRSTTTFLFSGRATRDILLTLFDGCRIYEKAAHRHYASIETTLFSLIAIISGARPEENCTAAAFAIGALAAVELLYIVLVLPLRTRLDMIFSVLNATVLVVLSVAVAISVQKRDAAAGGDAPDEWVVKTVEACLWAISVLGYTQLVVQGYWAYHVEQRRHRLEAELQSETESNSSDNDTSSLDEPLLVAEEMDERSGDDGEARNPLNLNQGGM